MKIGILTSSRADFGIYHSLINELNNDKNFITEIIVFGSHLQQHHGLTLNEIKNNFNNNVIKIKGMPKDDKQIDISYGYGKLVSSFSKFWDTNKYDLVFALGDRFEMSAAIQSCIPFEIKIAHIHGGETTMGSTDNIYRHQISLASNIHFTSNEKASIRLIEVLGDKNNIYNVGSLSLDNITSMSLPSWNTTLNEFKIPDKPYVLVTFHPETVEQNKNFKYIKIIENTLLELSKNIYIIITLANADSCGSNYRDLAFRIKNAKPDRISVIHSFGKTHYFNAIKNSRFLLGNSSSGIIEAASYKKFVINVGNRQKGRMRSDNIIDVIYSKDEIISQSMKLIKGKDFVGNNNYFQKNSAEKIKNIINKLLNKTNEK